MRFRLSPSASWHAVFLLVAFLSGGCGAVRNPSLDRARDIYQKARQDPFIVRNAGAALDRAQLTLEAAERVWEEDRDVNETEHLAYIAEKRVEIARVTAQRRQAAEEIRQGAARP